MSSGTPIPTGPTPKVKATPRLAETTTSAASDIEDPWALLAPPEDAQPQVMPSVARQPASCQDRARKPDSCQVPSCSAGLLDGGICAKVVRAMSSPYDSNARQAAMAIGVVPDFGFSMPMEEGLLGEVFSHKKNQKRSQFSWPQASSVSYLEEQNGVPFPTPKTVVKAKPWKASVVHARSWSDKHDDLRSKVLETWKSLLLSAGSLTKVGVSLLKAQEIPDAEARVMQIVNDVSCASLLQRCRPGHRLCFTTLGGGIRPVWIPRLFLWMRRMHMSMCASCGLRVHLNLRFRGSGRQ